MTIRFRLVAALLLVAISRPTGAAAQTRSFELCFTTGTQSCSWFDVTTQAYLDDVTQTRVGTVVDVVVRHAEGVGAGSAALSALVGYSFHYAGVLTQPSADVDMLDDVGVPLWQPQEQGTSPATMIPSAWQLRAASSTAPAQSLTDSYYGLAAVGALELVPGVLLTNAIGGCGVAAAGGVIDGATGTDIWTCGAGNSYRFSTFTDVWFDIAKVNAIGVQTYARFDGEDFGVAAFCTGYLDETTSFGDDGRKVDEFGFPVYGDVCRARDLAVAEPPVSVPEPRTTVLVATGLLALVVAKRQRRTMQRGVGVG